MPISDVFGGADVDVDENGVKQNTFSKYIRVRVARGCMSLVSYISFMMRLNRASTATNISIPPLSSNQKF